MLEVIVFFTGQDLGLFSKAGPCDCLKDTGAVNWPSHNNPHMSWSVDFHTFGYNNQNQDRPVT